MSLAQKVKKREHWYREERRRRGRIET